MKKELEGKVAETKTKVDREQHGPREPIVLNIDQIRDVAAGMTKAGGSHTTMGFVPKKTY